MTMVLDPNTKGHIEYMSQWDKTFPGVNFTNILHKAFKCADTKSRKNVKPSAFFKLLGSVCIKAARKHVGEIYRPALIDTLALELDQILVDKYNGSLLTLFEKVAIK